MVTVDREVSGPGVRWEIEVSVGKSEFCHVVIREIRSGPFEEPKVYDMEVPYTVFDEIAEALQEGFDRIGTDNDEGTAI